MTVSMQVAINWPAMFCLDGVSLAPVFRALPGGATSTAASTSTPGAADAWVRTARKSESGGAPSPVLARATRKKFANISTVTSPLPAGTAYFGPLTTRIGTVVFGNVTKRLYHRYWCTTRNW